MDETIKILIGTLSGFIIAFLAEPVKTFFQNRYKLSNLRIALYKESMQNRSILELLVTKEIGKEDFINIAQFLLLNNCYKYVLEQEITFFYQLKEARLFNSAYKTLDKLINLTTEDIESRWDFVMELAKAYLGVIQDGLDYKTLDKRLLEKVTSKKEVLNILKKV